MRVEIPCMGSGREKVATEKLPAAAKWNKHPRKDQNSAGIRRWPTIPHTARAKPPRDTGERGKKSHRGVEGTRRLEDRPMHTGQSPDQ